ncbi:class IV adenylate cyclase [uncultured Brachyspira sp.]|uniref:class IV adenylate cyclase n=1 Tax=uncultured Brachyspira sp. TaxID=221953 RepID=UPI002593D3EE|nr:class IV adenylate cyclase [uncultured Brachyspira sp.]
MVNNEIEIKAYVRDFENTLSFLYKNARFKKKYFKKDIYYAKKDDILNDDIKLKNCIRLRVEHGGYTFCSKDRKLIDGVEVNDEIELKVSKKNARFIINFLSSLQGYREYVRKEKKGYAFTYKNSLVEVSKIKGLGDFVEIEFLNSEESVENQVSQLKKILQEIGIDEKDIETRAYIDMLKKAKEL